MFAGGTVSSRSVKLLERITNLEEPETRDTWWKELRMEVRSHARALGCNVVLGYSEHTSIWYGFYSSVIYTVDFVFTIMNNYIPLLCDSLIFVCFSVMMCVYSVLLGQLL